MYFGAVDGAETTAAIDAAIGDQQDTAFVEQAGRDLLGRAGW